MALLVIYLLPFFVGAWIGIAAKRRFWVAALAGAALASPRTATFVPSLLASRPDSPWFTAIPALGAGLVCGGTIAATTMLLQRYAARTDRA